MTLRTALSFCFAALAVSACATSPQVQMGPDARVTEDGLHFVDNTVMDEAWFRPDADLTRYSKLMIVGAGTHFANGHDTTDALRRKHDHFEEIVVEEFTAALRDLQGFEIVEAAGPDVLLMHGAILNVELVEDVSGPGRRIFVRELGSADLVIDLRDSVTGEAIAVARDNGVLELPGREMTEATDAATWSAVRRQAKSWATLLRDRLETLASYRLGGAEAG